MTAVKAFSEKPRMRFRYGIWECQGVYGDHTALAFNPSMYKAYAQWVVSIQYQRLADGYMPAPLAYM